jgi:hypothetical protein
MDDWTRWMIMKATEIWVTWFWRTCGKGMRNAANHESIRFYVWLNVYCQLMLLYLSQRRATPEVVAETEQTAELEAEIAELGKTIGDFTLNRDLASRIQEMTSAISKANRPVWAGMDPRHPNPARFATMIGKLSPMTNRAIDSYRVPKSVFSSYGNLAHRNLFNGITTATEPYSSIRRMASAFHGIDTSPTAAPKITGLGSQLARLATANMAARPDLRNVASGFLPSHQKSILDKLAVNRKPLWSGVDRLSTFNRANTALPIPNYFARLNGQLNDTRRRLNPPPR